MSISRSPVENYFSLRGSNETFSQRQADIFGNLQALEEAHHKVHKDTKKERDIIKTLSWREPTPAVESLETEKLAKEKTSTQVGQQNIDADAPFRIPAPVAFSKRHTRKRGPHARDNFSQLHDTSKWMRYSLADVDEDAGADRALAVDLLEELRRRRVQNEEEAEKDTHETDEIVSSSVRILFRPTHGKKKMRFNDDSQPQVLSTTSPLIGYADESAEIIDCDPIIECSEESSSVNFRSCRRNRHSNKFSTRFNDDTAEDWESDKILDELEVCSRSDSPTEDDIDDIYSLEDAPEGL